jgi:hypothetical protein
MSRALIGEFARGTMDSIRERFGLEGEIPFSREVIGFYIYFEITTLSHTYQFKMRRDFKHTAVLLGRISEGSATKEEKVFQELAFVTSEEQAKVFMEYFVRGIVLNADDLEEMAPSITQEKQRKAIPEARTLQPLQLELPFLCELEEFKEWL